MGFEVGSELDELIKENDELRTKLFIMTNDRNACLKAYNDTDLELCKVRENLESTKNVLDVQKRNNEYWHSQFEEVRDKLIDMTAARDACFEKICELEEKKKSLEERIDNLNAEICCALNEKDSWYEACRKTREKAESFERALECAKDGLDCIRDLADEYLEEC